MEPFTDSLSCLFGHVHSSTPDLPVAHTKTKHGLQLGMNALYEFCSATTLTVNTNKSEVMYVSKR